MGSHKKHHICADVRMINNSGIGVYIQKYVEYMLDCGKYEVSLIGRKAEAIKSFGHERKWSHIEANFPIYTVKEQLLLPPLIPKCDIFWSPHYNIPLAPIRAKKRIVTVPDVFHLAHMESLSTAQKIYAKIMTNAAVRLADRVTTISNFSKHEIMTYTGIDGHKISTIFLGIDSKLYSPNHAQSVKSLVSTKYSLPKNYILFVGNVKPNKNVKALVDTLQFLRSSFPDLKLLIVGKKEGFIMKDNKLFSQIEQDSFLKESVQFTGYVDTEHLPVIYSMAAVFAFPSLYEGFGFPPLEAMACGCPVVVSDRASIPEICGDAAVYFDPLDPKLIAQSVSRVLSDQNVRDRMIIRGLKKVTEYNWLDSQKLFDNVITELV